MRGKLEQTKASIELISIEVERVDIEYNELWVSFEYTCPGGEYKSAMPIPIGNSMDMTNHFFRELTNEARHLSEMEGDESLSTGLIVCNKASTMLHIKNLCQRVIDSLDYEGVLSESASYIDLCTSGTDFRTPSNSLSVIDFEERFRIFMTRAKDKMSHGYYTIAADDLEKAKVLCSSSSLIFKLIGICHRELGHLDLALEMFLKSLELGDNDKETFLYIAEIYFFLGDMENASNTLNKLIMNYPDDSRVLVELANVLYQQEKDYLEVIERAYKIDPEETRTAIIQTFVFKKNDNKNFKRISLEKASEILKIPSSTIMSLAAKHRIPARQDPVTDMIIFDEVEIKSWALVYRRFGLLQNEIERVSSTIREQEDKGLAVLS
jgi:tetratricopeptide (TPR) repeat protein